MTYYGFEIEAEANITRAEKVEQIDIRFRSDFNGELRDQMKLMLQHYL